MEKGLDKRGKIISISLFVIFSLFCIFLIFFIPPTRSWMGSGAGPYNCSGCADCTAAIGNASAGATIYLNTSLSGINNTCIDFGNKSNVIFDCQNYSNFIQGNFSNTNYGITLSSLNNNIIRNCNVSQFYFGIYLLSSNYNTLTNITTNNNSAYGIYFSSSSNNNLTTITANNNSISGIFFSSSNNNNLTTITANNNSNYGVRLDSSSNNILTGFTLIQNLRGLQFFTSVNNNIVTNITATSNSDGFSFSLANNNTLTNIITNNNANYGFYFALTENNSFVNVTASSNGAQGIYLVSGNNNLFRNVTTNLNLQDGLLVGSNNNTLTKIISNLNNGNGIYFNFVYNNTLNDSTANGNNQSGVYLLRSNFTSVFNMTSNNNSLAGISVTLSSNNTLISITANNNSNYGIFLSQSSNNNTLTNITANINNYGVYLTSSNNSVLTNITMKNNIQYGIAIQESSSYNTIRNSFIQYNNLSGLLLNFSGTAPKYNFFYNNYFNNSVPFSNISAVSTNFFNMSKTLGTNIVGGTYLGGNYWAALNGTGFSQTCTSSTNGICDTAYNLDGLNYDYLPLTCTESWSCGVWGSCSGSTQTRICTDANSCQTYKYRPITSQSCTTSGSLPPTPPPTETFSVVSPSQPAVMTINSSAVDLTKIIVNVNTTISNASLTVTPLSNTTGADLRVSLRRGALYQAYQITTIINNSAITNVTINFKVNATWLANQNGTTANIRLYRYYNNGWTSLPTTYTSKDSLYYYFSSISPGFSTFVVFFGEYDCNPNEIRCFNNEVQLCLGNSTWLVTEQCSYKCSNGKCVNASFNLNPNIIYAGAIIGIVAAIIVIFLILRRRISKGSSSRNTYSKFYQNQFIHKT